VARRAAELREAILREGPETVSAVILEPVVSSGGFIIPPIGWLRAVRRLCNELDVLMIADEVITGFGRTGRWFASEHDGVVPDLLTVAKGITSGYVPLSASIAGRRLADAFPEDAVQENVHPNTYAAHPVACAAALANLTIMEKGLVDNAQAMGARLLDGLRAALAGSPIVGEVRGRGLMVCGVRRAGRLRPSWTAWPGSAAPSSTREAAWFAWRRRSASRRPRSISSSPSRPTASARWRRSAGPERARRGASPACRGCAPSPTGFEVARPRA
jgi:hypothetical protein